jgi:adenylosuccinate synthase
MNNTGAQVTGATRNPRCQMKNETPHYVVYGGQYGSEGKASAAEFWANKIKADGHELIIIGENSPNSGHTSSRGATKNIPASSFWADAIMLGPDAVVDVDVLLKDWNATGCKPLYIHAHAALLEPGCKADESDLVKRISSTGSGSGMARNRKFIQRQTTAVVKDYKFPAGITILSSDEYFDYLHGNHNTAKILECSQGAMLDTNFGVFPYVTSRSTLPRVAVERNGLGALPWEYAGVYRTYPIRTGGPSGPTGGSELSWPQVGVPQEIVTVTKRIRRVFEFDEKDFCRSLRLTRPDHIMFTFLDYLGDTDLNNVKGFSEWLEWHNISEVTRNWVWVSNTTGKFVPYNG